MFKSTETSKYGLVLAKKPKRVIADPDLHIYRNKYLTQIKSPGVEIDVNEKTNNYKDYGSSDISPTSEYGISSIGTGVISGSKYSHSRLNVHGKMTGVGHQDYGVHYLSLTKFRKGGGYDIYGKKRQFLDYDTQGHVKKYGNQHMKAKFEVVGNLQGYSTFKDKSSFKPSGSTYGNYGGNGNGGQSY
ncbi:eggshell protein, chorion, putative [Schistosoma mansoni]|uniref:eggshell protein, chorion, putative n=1 Tax=Schistosoma mansoni TaxID=6183 RepID=UPI0001A61A8D|nr:eggshell protein, chorion, putative [Schistosoma mansoni]|eukprot:XP_018646326.1 eggshell protein, chorion, putative [Schistosoma mansoni]